MPISRFTLGGVLLVALSLLVTEIALTRIFSLVAWYHFAVLSISLALFGTAAGGMVVYLWPTAFSSAQLPRLLPMTSLAYAGSLSVAMLAFLGIPVTSSASLSGVLNLAVVYAVLSVPFFLGGLCLALVITHLSARVSTVYFADLLGACAGCLLVLPALDLLGAPRTVFLASLIAGLGSVCFAVQQGRLVYVPGQRFCIAAAASLIALGINPYAYHIELVKGQPEPEAIYEGWNSFSRVAVFPEEVTGRPFGWGLTDRYQGPNPGWMRLNIDGMAETPIVRFNGDLASVRFLDYDVSSLVYHLRTHARTLVIGPGGGRDVLTALRFDADQVHGAELNPLVVYAVRDRFREYAGGIYQHPRVSITVDDGRSFVERSGEHYDVLQASAVDTWAAGAAGAFALAENSLYTQEAFQAYYQHLATDGILAFSRYIYPGDRFGEALRLTGLALSSWQSQGVAGPREHLMVVVAPGADMNDPVFHGRGYGYVSLLMKRSPFTLAEVELVERVAAERGFGFLYAPFGRGTGIVRDFVMSESYPQFWHSYPIDISPPTDDRPFFFQMLRLTDIPRLGWQEVIAGNTLRILPMATLGVLLVLVTSVAAGFILGPLWWTRRADLRRDWVTAQPLLYFACLGMGFMMAEVALIQKFGLLLGHPTYALSTVLFTILLASSLGSLATARVPTASAARVGSLLGLVLVAILPLYIWLLPELQARSAGAERAVKILVSVVGLFPLGLVMGTLFPLGIKTLSGRAEHLIPWCWAINGATSVFASIFALAVGIQFGISAELAGGWASYVVATASLLARLPHGGLMRGVLLPLGWGSGSTPSPPHRARPPSASAHRLGDD